MDVQHPCCCGSTVFSWNLGLGSRKISNPSNQHWVVRSRLWTFNINILDISGNSSAQASSMTFAPDVSRANCFCGEISKSIQFPLERPLVHCIVWSWVTFDIRSTMQIIKCGVPNKMPELQRFRGRTVDSEDSAKWTNRCSTLIEIGQRFARTSTDITRSEVKDTRVVSEHSFYGSRVGVDVSRMANHESALASYFTDVLRSGHYSSSR